MSKRPRKRGTTDVLSLAMLQFPLVIIVAWRLVPHRTHDVRMISQRHGSFQMPVIDAEPIGALDAATGRLVLPGEAAKGGAYACLLCHKPVYLRAGHARTNQSIRQHFSHYPSQACHGELRQMAKNLLKEAVLKLGHLCLSRRCPSCGRRDEVHKIGFNNNHGEVVLDYAVPGKDCMVDVAVLFGGPLVKILYCAFVVVRTDYTPEDLKRPEPWYELEASALINNLTRALEATHKNEAFDPDLECLRNHGDCNMCHNAPSSGTSEAPDPSQMALTRRSPIMRRRSLKYAKPSLVYPDDGLWEPHVPPVRAYYDAEGSYRLRSCCVCDKHEYTPAVTTWGTPRALCMECRGAHSGPGEIARIVREATYRHSYSTGKGRWEGIPKLRRESQPCSVCGKTYYEPDWWPAGKGVWEGGPRAICTECASLPWYTNMMDSMLKYQSLHIR